MVALAKLQPQPVARAGGFAQRTHIGQGLGAIDGGFTQAQQVQVRADRKSTRLNSSHLVISYAVFCLKKKKKNICSMRRGTPYNHDRTLRISRWSSYWMV